MLAGLLARVIYLQQVAGLPFFHDPVGDSALYLERAREILDGRFLPDGPFFYGGILYPWVLAGSALLFGANLYPVVLLQACLGCLTAWLMHRLVLAASLDPGMPEARAAALAAAAGALFYGPFAFLEADILMVSWTLPLVTGAALLMMRAVRSGAGATPWRGAALLWWAGVALGLTATERPNLALLIPCAAAWTWIVLPPGRRREAAALAAAALAVLAGIAAMNRAASGRWVLLTTSAGINFYIGNHAGASGTFDEPWSGTDRAFAARETDLRRAGVQMARRLSGRELDEVEASRFWLARGWEWIASNPGDAGRLYARKLALLWNAREVPNHLHFGFLREAAPALWLMPLGFAVAAPLGLYGLLSPAVRRTRARGGSSLLALFTAAPMLSVLPFFVADRYRIAVVPALVAASGPAVVRLAGLLASRATRPGGVLRSGLVAAAAAVSLAPMGETDRSRDYWLMAQALKKQGRLEEAISWYSKASAASPRDSALRNNLGVALMQSGQHARAEEEFRKAIAAEPDLPLPHKNLGLLLLRAGRTAQAIESLRRSDALQPGDPEVAAALSAAGSARPSP